MASDDGVVNQTPPFAGINLFGSNPALEDAARNLSGAERSRLSQLGAQWGSAEFFELGYLANTHEPKLLTHDARGARKDAVEFHPTYHRLMQAGMEAQIHNLT